MLTTLAIGTAYPTTSLSPDEAAVVMPTTSPWSSYVAPPESPGITSLLISIRPLELLAGAAVLVAGGDALVEGGHRAGRGC